MFKQKILMVDDEPDYVEMIKMRLEASGYEVISANSGEDGLRMAATETPSLILLDVMMPGMDGFATLREIRRHDPTKYIPVIMLTAKGESKSIFQAQGEGATDYLTKPCDPQELLSLIAKHATL